MGEEHSHGREALPNGSEHSVEEEHPMEGRRSVEEGHPMEGMRSTEEERFGDALGTKCGGGGLWHTGY